MSGYMSDLMEYAELKKAFADEKALLNEHLPSKQRWLEMRNLSEEELTGRAIAFVDQEYERLRNRILYWFNRVEAIANIKSSLEILRYDFQRYPKPRAASFSESTDLILFFEGEQFPEKVIDKVAKYLDNIVNELQQDYRNAADLIREKTTSENSAEDTLSAPLRERLRELHFNAQTLSSDQFMEESLRLLPELRTADGITSIGQVELSDQIRSEARKSQDTSSPEEERQVHLHRGLLQPSLMWKDRKDRSYGASPIPFIREHWADRLDGGLTISEIRSGDAALAARLTSWFKAHGPLGLEGLNIDMAVKTERQDRGKSTEDAEMAAARRAAVREYEKKRKSEYRARSR